MKMSQQTRARMILLRLRLRLRPHQRRRHSRLILLPRHRLQPEPLQHLQRSNLPPYRSYPAAGRTGPQHILTSSRPLTDGLPR